MCNTFEIVQEDYEELNDSEEFVHKNLELRGTAEKMYFRVKAVLPPRAAPGVPSLLANVKLPTISLPECQTYVVLEIFPCQICNPVYFRP